MQHILNFEGLIVQIVHIIHSDNVISSEHVIDIFICNCLLGVYFAYFLLYQRKVGNILHLDVKTCVLILFKIMIFPNILCS